MIKSAAYVLSMIGLILLGVVGWSQADAATGGRFALAAGVLLSLAGLVLRLIWHSRELARVRRSTNRREGATAERQRQAEGAGLAAGAP